MYKKRKEEFSEICLIQDEIPLFFKEFGVPEPKNYEIIEYAVMEQMQKVTLLNEVRDVLDKLQGQGILMYILSNSIFTGNAARKLLDDFGILHYFKKLYSSADYGIRKPDPRFYQIAIDEILSGNSGIKKEDILYVGNDYVTDVAGATSVGLSTVWYNVKHLPNTDNIYTTEIDDFKKLLELCSLEETV